MTRALDAHNKPPLDGAYERARRETRAIVGDDPRVLDEVRLYGLAEGVRWH
jgi:hypothetical protein